MAALAAPAASPREIACDRDGETFPPNEAVQHRQRNERKEIDMAYRAPRPRWNSIARPILAMLLSAGALATLGGPACRKADAQSRAPLSMEIVTEAGLAVTAPQRWLEVLGKLGVDNLQIRSARAGEKAEIINDGTAEAPRYRVRGILTSRDQLVLPGGRFSRTDRADIADWLDKVRSGGQEGLRPKQVAAFGLSPEELVELHKTLAAKVGFSTAGQTPKEVVRKLALQLPLGVKIDPAAVAAFDGETTVLEELRDVSAGTALAVVLRPLGLIMAPEKRPTLHLQITDVRNREESWPIGWPSEQTEREVLPKLYEFLPVEIAETPLAEVLSAIQGRLQVPFVYDQNSLARQRIDPAAVKVSFPAKRTYYKKVIDTVLFHARLKAEVRVDEAGQPLLWVTTLIRP